MTDRHRIAGPLPRCLATATREDLEREQRALTETINAAYWSFTRSRGLPTAIAVPGAYARRAWVDEALRRMADMRAKDRHAPMPKRWSAAR